MQAQIDLKNLTFLEDTMNLEALACKKCETYAQAFTDPNCKTLANQLSQHHRQRFDALYNYLKSHS